MTYISRSPCLAPPRAHPPARASARIPAPTFTQKAKACLEMALNSAGFWTPTHLCAGIDRGEYGKQLERDAEKTPSLASKTLIGSRRSVMPAPNLSPKRSASTPQACAAAPRPDPPKD